MTEVLSEALGDIDLVNPDHYVDDVPCAWFDRLRNDHPVIWHPEPARRTTASGRSRATTTSRRSTWTGRRSRPRSARSRSKSSTTNSSRSASSMLETDPPRHTELRQICSKRFCARGVGKYEDWIRDVAHRVLDQALPKGEFDFVSEISRELPIRFLCSIFTVPQEDAPKLIGWGDKMIANQDPDLSAAVVDKVDTEDYRLLPFRSPAALDVFAYADRQRDLRVAEPADDVLQALTVAQSEGVLNEQEFHNYFGVLMIAGNETTRHTISHGMLALMQHPEQLQLLRTSRS